MTNLIDALTKFARSNTRERIWCACRDEAYTELNELTVGRLPRHDLVIAKRIGDCREESAGLKLPSDLSIENCISARC